MTHPTELIQRYCREADQSAFRNFYRSQSGKLWKFLIARGCDPDSAYDLLAEAFLRFIQSVCRDPSAPVAFLYRIAVNLRIDAHRRQQAAPVDPGVDPEGVPAETPADPDDSAHLRALIAGLPEREQNLLLMRYWIGLSHREVAEALNLPPGTVRRRCAEAVQTLRERWGRE